MRAAVIHQFGGTDGVELGERPAPQPGSGEVLVKVKSAGVGPWDVGIISAGFPGITLPFVPGQEIAGVVEAVGTDVDLKPGDRVYGSLFPAGGGFAEFAVASCERLAVMPAKLEFNDAAGLVIGAGTAYEALVDRGQMRAGQAVLVTAAAGGVGSAAVQIAAAMGARPIAIASPNNHDYLRQLGASEVFDYHEPDWADQVLKSVPGGVDLLLDAAGGETRDQAIKAVRDGGRAMFIVIHGPQAQLERGIKGDAFAARILRPRLEALNRLFEDGKLRPQTETIMPLAEARQALEKVASRHVRGKIVLRVENKELF